MYYDTFDPGFNTMPTFDSGFGSPMFNGTGCFPVPPMNTGFNGGFVPSVDFGFGMGMPMTGGFSPAPFDCNPSPIDVHGNVCIDGIPITTNIPPMWMVARATQANTYLHQLDMQLNDPNFWMSFIPQEAFHLSTIDLPPMPEVLPDTPLDPFAFGFPMSPDLLSDMSAMDVDLGKTNEMDTATTMWKGEEVLPCGLTQSQYDQNMSKYQSLLADSERQLENCDPNSPALRAMIMNNIDRINRHIRELGKPLGAK